MRTPPLSRFPGLVAFTLLVGCGARSELRVPHPGDTVASDASDTETPRVRAISIAAGSYFACAAMSDATTRCWGANDRGQLGDGTTIAHSRPVNVVLAEGAARLAAGGSHACAQAPGGGVYCWGDDTFGQLCDGPGHPPFAATAVRVLIDDVGGLALGRDHTVVRNSADDIIACGSNEYCQLGLPRSSPQSEPYVLGDPPTAAVIFAGGQQTCAIARAGGFGCTGTEEVGQNTCAPRVGISWFDAVQIAAGEAHYCVRSNAGQVYCLGRNDDGQLGDGTMQQRYGYYETPVRDAIDAAAGRAHTCVVHAGGTVSCWGANTMGQLGVRAGDPTRPSEALAIDAHITALALGDDFSCALDEAGAVWCWGGNAAGQLGDGTRIQRTTPARVLF